MSENITGKVTAAHEAGAGHIWYSKWLFGWKTKAAISW